MYPQPAPGASVLVSFQASKRTSVLILGTNHLAANRALACLEAGFSVRILSDSISPVSPELLHRKEQKQLVISPLQNVEEILPLLQDANLACLLVTDTIAPQSRSISSIDPLLRACFDQRVPVNVADHPAISDFTFPTTHRFNIGQSENKSPLQVAIATNGSACRLAARIRRMIVSALPASLGEAVLRIAELRALVKLQTPDASEEPEWSPQINTPVEQRSFDVASGSVANVQEAQWIKLARMRFVAQISEHWPVEQIARLTKVDIERLLELSSSPPSPASFGDHASSRHSLDLKGRSPAAPGRIYLVGSGPGSPSLLTRAAYDILTKQATVVLSDKLVPSQILALVPPHVKLTIAKKFPGNAEGAQSELMELALEAAQQGHTVVRLKQGDIFLYGRGGEEVLYFRRHGFESTVIPGLSSALAVPAIANIPVTQRGVAESMTICTGVGRGGKGVKLPGYQKERTLVVLMGVARLLGVVHALTSQEGTETGREGGERDGPAYPKNTPIAILERGSSPDQRVISSTLEHIVEAMESLDEQRSPGMLVIGWSVMCLAGEGFVKVTDADSTELEAQAQKWLGTKRWRITEGLPADWLFD